MAKSTRKRPMIPGLPALNVRPISEQTKRELTVGKAQQGLRTYAAYLERLERLRRIVEREARKASANSSALARAWLTEAGLRFDPEGH